MNILWDAYNSVADMKVDLPEGTKALLPDLCQAMNQYFNPDANTKQRSGRVLVELVASFDAMQPPNNWVQSWSDILSAVETMDHFKELLRNQTGLPHVPDEDEVSRRLSGLIGDPKRKETEKVEKEEDKEEDDVRDGEKEEEQVEEEDKSKTDQEAQEDEQRQRPNHSDSDPKQKQVPEQKAETGLKTSDLSSMDMIPVEKLNGFYDLKLLRSGVLHDSEDAKKLGLSNDAFTSEGLQVFQAKMQEVVWKAFRHISQADMSSVFLNMQGKAQDRIQVKRPVPSGLRLPFAGAVTQQPPKDIGKIMYLCRVFGMDYYISPMHSDVLQHEVVVPAWSVRGVSKADQAYFQQEKLTFSVILHAPDDASDTHLSLFDVGLEFVPPEKTPPGIFAGVKHCLLMQIKLETFFPA